MPIGLRVMSDSTLACDSVRAGHPIKYVPVYIYTRKRIIRLFLTKAYRFSVCGLPYVAYDTASAAARNPLLHCAG